MSTLTREWLQQTIAEFEVTRDDIPFGLDEDDAKILAALKLTLATMQQKPVAWMLLDPEFGHSVATKAGFTLEFYKSNGWEITPLYAYTQPAQEQSATNPSTEQVERVENSDWMALAAVMYQAAGAYSMPEHVLDLLSAAQGGEKFSHLLDVLPVLASQSTPEREKLEHAYAGIDQRNREIDNLNRVLSRLAVILSGSDAPGENKALTVTAQSFVDRCNQLAKERDELRSAIQRSIPEKMTPADIHNLAIFDGRELDEDEANIAADTWNKCRREAMRQCHSVVWNASPQPAPVVPDRMTTDPDADVIDPGFVSGWNACRDAMLDSVPFSPPESSRAAPEGRMTITVGYPQTNRKTDTGKTLKRWPVLVDHFKQPAAFTAKRLTIMLPDTSSKAFWSGTGKSEVFHPETYRRWVKEAIERQCTIADIEVMVK